MLTPLLLSIALTTDGWVIPAVPWYVTTPDHEHTRSVAIEPLPGNHFERIDAVTGAFVCVSGSLGTCSVDALGRISIGGDEGTFSQWHRVGSAAWACVRTQAPGVAGGDHAFDWMVADFSNGRVRSLASSKAPILSSASQRGSVTLLTRDDANPATGWVELRSPGTFDAQTRTAIDLADGTPSAFLLVSANKLITIDADRGEVVQYELEQGAYRELRTVPVPVGWIPNGLCSLEKTAVLTARVGDDAAIGVIDTRNGLVKPLTMRWPDGDEYTPSAAKQYPHGAIESMLGSASRAAAIVDGLGVWVNVNPSALTCSCQWTCAKEPEIAHVGHGVGDTLLIVRGAERILSRFASKDGSWIEDLGKVPAGFGNDSLAVLTETSSGRVFFQRASLEPLYTVRDPDTGRWANMTLPGELVAEDDSGGLVCIQSGKLVRARSISDSSKPDTLVELQGFIINEAVVTSDGLCCLAEPLVMTKCLTDPSDAGKALAVPVEPRLLFTDMTGKVRATVELSRSMGSRWLVAVGGDCCVLSSSTKGWLVTSGGEKRSFEVGLTPGAGVGDWYSWLGSTSAHRISLVDQVRGRVWMVDVER